MKMFSAKKEFIFGSFVGSIVYFALYGPESLNPANFGWLMKGDSATHFIGWHFFRKEPWGVPLGGDWSYGMGMGGSIVYSDSIPLFALCFKLFSDILPSPFQYTGIWILFCHILQGGISCILLRRFTADRFVLLCGCLLLLLSPVMHARLVDHFALGGQWIILCAFMLYSLKTMNCDILWTALLVIAVLVHAYLFIMVAFIWGASLTNRVIHKEIGWKKAGMIGVGTLGVTGSFMWLAGYFIVGSIVESSGELFGIYRMNLTSMIDPNHWSYILPDIPGGKGDHEGFNYLGAGVLSLVVPAGASLYKKRPSTESIRKLIPLALTLLLLTMLAISDHVGFASNELFVIPLPNRVISILHVVRSSGRLFWPVYYAIILCLIYLLVSRCSRWVRLLLGLAIVLQICDSPVFIKKLGEMGSRQLPVWQNPLKDPFWTTAALKYRNIRMVLPEHMAPDWLPFSYYAASHGKPINVGYFARINLSVLTQETALVSKTVETGHYDNNSIYIFNDDKLWAQAYFQSGKKDYRGEVDGFRVVAPEWYK